MKDKTTVTKLPISMTTSYIAEVMLPELGIELDYEGDEVIYIISTNDQEGWDKVFGIEDNEGKD